MTLKTLFHRHYFIWLVLSLSTFSACKKSSQSPRPAAEVTSTFTNPLLNSAPDPWVYKKDSTYYYTHTLGNRIQLWKTSKMSKLNQAVPVTVFTAPASGNNARDIWAPELFYLDNKWYLYYTASDGNDRSHRMWVLENTGADPTTGTWTDRGMLTTDPEDLWSIDGTILEYNNNRYMIWSGRPFEGGSTDLTQDLYISKMSNPYTLTGSTVKISTPEYDWEKNGFGVNEGPEILKSPDGKILIVYSASYCGNDQYGLGTISLKEGADPVNSNSWTKNARPVFVSSPSANAYAVGHNSFFKSKDGKEDWIIYHANTEAGQGCGNNRNVRMQKFSWTAAGMPVFGEPLPTGRAIPVPSGE